jgi:gliding motility-associated-like protein
MVDSCNKQAMLSENIAHTIYLSCTITASNTNLLEWNDYSTWAAGVDRYEVYRTVNGLPDPVTPLAVITSPPWQVEDDPNALIPTTQACYYIRAVEMPGNPMVPGAYSISNTACPIREPVFYMPNAFYPGGLNNKFRPVQAFIDPGNFNMLIYNKWGQLIFETNDLYNGWDGYVKGKLAPMDVYFYRVTYKSLQGVSFDKKGLVTLVQ